MKQQLILIDSIPEWTLDSHTREIGLEGVRKARDILAAVPRRQLDDEAATASSAHATAA